MSAATVWAALAGGQGGVDAAETAFTDRYAALLDRVEADRSLPTLVRFVGGSEEAILGDLGVEYRTHSDRPVAHAELTPDQAATVAAADQTDTVEYAPGSNPFWRLEGYDEWVFPPPAEAADYIAHEEALAGLAHLQKRHPERLRVSSIGSGHGHESRREGGLDPQAVWVAELTESVETAGERETVVFEMGIHGDERAGVEAGLRFIEGVLTGEHPEVADRLSSLRLVFVSLNPDGWVVREPLYEDPVDPPDFRRTNGAARDLNRQQPTPGWIPPGRAPGEPRADPPAVVVDEVPETLGLVQHLRGYENVSYLVDFHGMYGHTEAVLALESAGGTPHDRGDSELLGRALGAAIRDTLGTVGGWADSFEVAATDTEAQVGCSPELLCQTPERLFARGTTLDTIDYTTAGALADWAALPETVGGLDATTLTPEVVFSNSVPDGMEKRFHPELVAFQVAAYRAVCRATVDHATDDIGVTVNTGGRSTAYLASESVVRRAAELPHVDGDSLTAAPPGSADSAVFTGTRADGERQTADRAGSTLAVDRQTLTSGVTSTVPVPAGTHTLTVDIRAQGGRVVNARLGDGEGNVQRLDGETDNRSLLTALDPAAGEWEVEATVRGADTAELRTTRLHEEGVPDPVEALGYGQRDYEVTPLGALEELGAAADGTVEAVTVETLRADGLLADGEPAYDNVVLTHGDISAEVRETLASYVEAGGNLVLTDSALELAGELGVAGLSAVGRGDITRQALEAAAYPELATDHPLVTDRRTTPEESWVDQREAWRHPPLGYARGEVPMYTVSEGPLREAGATVASVADGAVRLATVPTESERVGVHLLGSLLPPAAQHNLHPFGLLDHSLTTLGYLLLCNALGYRLALSRNGRQVATLGSLVADESDGRSATAGADDGPDRTGADDDGPGLGVAAAAGGVGGLWYLLSRRVARGGTDTRPGTGADGRRHTGAASDDPNG